jgi:hypothetical protein
MADSLVPRLDAPPYIPITMQDVWGEVKERWADMYSPEQSCPVDKFGPPGSPAYEICKKTLEETWDKIKDELPDYPSGGPYNPPVDLVSVEDICYVASHDEDSSFPNMFQDLGALAKRLQESYKRRVAPAYCEPAPQEFPPSRGGCICLPYFVTVTYEYRQEVGIDPWLLAAPSTSPVWGPVGGVSVVNRPVSPDNPLGGYAVLIDSQGQRLTLFGGWNCSPERIKAVTAGSSGGEARLAGGASIVPFSIADCEFYFGQAPEGYPDLTGECTVPFPPKPSPDAPNSLPFAMPTTPPVFAFPVTSPGCPEETNVLEIRVVYEDGIGPAGADGEKGEKGESGETTMRRPVKLFSQNTLENAPAIAGNDITAILPLGCVYVRIDWVSVLEFPKAQYVRQFHESMNDGKLDEFQLGRIYLSVAGEDGWFSPYVQASKGQTLVEVPDSPDIQYKISVTDVSGIGVSIVDIGYRYRDFRWQNPEDIPELEYVAP